jgi:RNA polymerase sigma-70 factor (ECF subfamily)
MSEEEQRAWAEAARKGDESAFEKIFRHYQVSLYNWARHLVGDPDEAEDVVQQAFIKIYRALPGVRELGALDYWLKRIVYTTSMDHLRQRKRRAETSWDDRLGRHNVASRGPEADTLYQEQLDMVQVALQKLPERYRAYILLREFEGKTYDEISEILGEPTTTVRVVLFRARERLRELLRQLAGEDANEA